MVTAISDTEQGLLAATQSGIKLIDLTAGQVHKTICDPEADLPTNRYNDGKCDSMGRFWVGSLAFNLEKGAGSLYRIDLNGKPRMMETGLTLPNGLGWSADNRTMYLIDTADRVVYAYNFDQKNGQIEDRVDGWCVRKYSPTGELLAEFSVPFPRPTSCLCASDGSRRVIVTSARIRVTQDLLQKHPLAGSVISIPMP